MATASTHVKSVLKLRRKSSRRKSRKIIRIKLIGQLFKLKWHEEGQGG